MKIVFCTLVLVLLTVGVRSTLKDADKAALETLRNVISNVGTKLEKGADKGKGFAEGLDGFLGKVSEKAGNLQKPVKSFIDFLKSVAGTVSGTSTEGKKTIAKELKTLGDEAKSIETKDAEANVPGFVQRAINKMKSLIDKVAKKVG